MAKKKAVKEFDFSKPIARINLSSDYMVKYIEEKGSEGDMDAFIQASFDENGKYLMTEARKFFAETYPNMVIQPEKKKKPLSTIDKMRIRFFELKGEAKE